MVEGSLLPTLLLLAVLHSSSATTEHAQGVYTLESSADCTLVAEVAARAHCVPNITFGCYALPERVMWVRNGCRGSFRCHHARTGICGRRGQRMLTNCSCEHDVALRDRINGAWWSEVEMSTAGAAGASDAEGRCPQLAAEHQKQVVDATAAAAIAAASAPLSQLPVGRPLARACRFEGEARGEAPPVAVFTFVKDEVDVVADW